MIDTSPSSIRIFLVMVLGTVWFVLLIDTILRNYDD